MRVSTFRIESANLSTKDNENYFKSNYIILVLST